MVDFVEIHPIELPNVILVTLQLHNETFSFSGTAVAETRFHSGIPKATAQLFKRRSSETPVGRDLTLPSYLPDPSSPISRRGGYRAVPFGVLFRGNAIGFASRCGVELLGHMHHSSVLHPR